MKTTLEYLFQQNTLEQHEAYEHMRAIAEGDIPAEQVAAFLSVFRMRRITLSEFLGFRKAMKEKAQTIKLKSAATIDLCGTGGDGKDTFNISTLTSFVVAGAGAKVAKHGNYGVSSVSGSSNVLETLGHTFTNNEQKLNEQLSSAGICFLHAPLFHPAMKQVAPIRKALGVKTFFNLLGPLVNPANPTHQFTGVYDYSLARLYHYVLQHDKSNYCIVHSGDGYDEISLTSEYKCYTNQGIALHQPGVNVPFKRIDTESLKGGRTVEESAELFVKVLRGKGTKAQETVVTANAAHALKTYFGDTTLQEAIEKAKISLNEKLAYKAFENFIKT
jgi:anthranilate phosphoribosyltransferase